MADIIIAVNDRELLEFKGNSRRDADIYADNNAVAVSELA
jgi:hypothetical protein